MDQLGKSLNNISLWEVKSYVRKAQNAVLNLSEIETKVREATNNEPWGASTTLMAEISRGTFNYRDREEICNMIFRRFTEKSAHEWRQIYKSLQLMEYLIKNGSERFVDDARANVSIISMLKSFHYIDSKGVDQGINVRNRARELTSLLNDESKIRQERKKAKENAKKFDAISSTSVGSRSIGRRPAGRNAGASSSNWDDEEGYETRVFGDGGVYGQRFEESRNNITPSEFEEYDIDEETNSHSNNKSSKPTVGTSRVNAHSNLDFFSDSTSNNNSNDNDNSNSNKDNDDDDDDFDDFDDFQSATPNTQQPTANVSKPTNNLADLLSTSYSTPQQQQQLPSYSASNSNTAINNSGFNSAPVAQPKKQTDDIFGSLLMSAKKSGTPSRQPSASITKQTASFNDNFLDTPKASRTTPAPAASSSGVVDLLDL